MGVVTCGQLGLKASDNVWAKFKHGARWEVAGSSRMDSGQHSAKGLMSGIRADLMFKNLFVRVIGVGD
jgi:hypothetical protein